MITRKEVLEGQGTDSAHCESVLAEAAAGLRLALLRAPHRPIETFIAHKEVGVLGSPPPNPWLQSKAAGLWPYNPLSAAELLVAAESMCTSLEQNEMCPSGTRQSLARTISCHEHLQQMSNPVFGAHLIGSGRLALVSAVQGSTNISPEAGALWGVSEAAQLILAGYSVALLTSPGSALEAAHSAIREIPAELVDVAAWDCNEALSMPQNIHCIRQLGAASEMFELSSGSPCADFGGADPTRDFEAHGMVAVLPSLVHLRTHFDRLKGGAKAEYTFQGRVEELLSWFSSALPEIPGSVYENKGLQRPRWAESPYSRAVGEISDVLDVFWGLAGLHSSSSQSDTSAGEFKAAPVHLVLAASATDFPEELLKLAVLLTASPWMHEVTLHLVGESSSGSGVRYGVLGNVLKFVERDLNWKLEWHANALALHNSLCGYTCKGESLRVLGHAGLRTVDEIRAAAAAAGSPHWASWWIPEPLQMAGRLLAIDHFSATRIHSAHMEFERRVVLPSEEEE